MAAFPQPISDYYNYDQYLEINDVSKHTKYEYCYGKILAMAGGKFNHNMIKDNINEHVRAQLRGTCVSMTSDMQLKIDENVAVYPDVLIICGKPQFLKHQGKIRDDIVTNATVIFEVLSESTKDYDRGDKAEAYRAMAGLKEHFLVNPDKAEVVHYYRDSNRWHSVVFESIDDTVSFKSVDCTLKMKDIYMEVDLKL